MGHKTVGNNLKSLRKEKDLTQADLAALVGLARVSINSIENGRFIPTIETALRISKVLETPIDEIFWIKEK